MDRTIPYEPDATCDICGDKGATDFMGDYICPDCYEIMQEEAQKGQTDALPYLKN